MNALHGVWGANAQFHYKGQNISNKEWQDNELFFKSTICNCQVHYNNEYRDSFDLDYNNIVSGISDAQLVSSYLNSIMLQLNRINDTFVLFTKHEHDTEQNK